MVEQMNNKSKQSETKRNDYSYTHTRAFINVQFTVLAPTRAEHLKRNTELWLNKIEQIFMIIQTNLREPIIEQNGTEDNCMKNYTHKHASIVVWSLNDGIVI